MSIFHKLFGKTQKIQEESLQDTIPVDQSPDSLFVAQFKKNGGKFLYCDKKHEVLEYLKNIFDENNWDSAFCTNNNLNKDLNIIAVNNDKKSDVFYTTCEHLITNDGSILFSSNQLMETKLTQYPINFIVYATTSQLIQTKDKALTSIKHRFNKKIPSNISAIKDYIPFKKDPNFLNYGNTNSKNLYLLLFEDL